MRIEWSPPLRPANAKRDERGASSERSFASGLSGEAAGSAKTQSSAATRAVEGLLALQEVADAHTGRRRAVARGQNLLDRLDELRVAMLTGVVPRADLAALARLSRESVALVDDPQLAEILAEIELRAAVELAKLGETI
jgi:hypothetical protein